MPCDSRIYQGTKMLDGERLQRVLTEAGITYTASKDGHRINCADGTVYARNKADEPYTIIGSRVGGHDYGAIGRRYAETTVRDVAKRKGYTVAKAPDGKLTLTMRRY